MTPSTMPLIILGGSDRKPARMPTAGRGLHPLASYKGVAIRVAGRPLIAHVIDRFRACPEFSPLRIAGPSPPLGLIRP